MEARSGGTTPAVELGASPPAEVAIQTQGASAALYSHPVRLYPVAAQATEVVASSSSPTVSPMRGEGRTDRWPDVYKIPEQVSGGRVHCYPVLCPPGEPTIGFPVGTLIPDPGILRGPLE